MPTTTTRKAATAAKTGKTTAKTAKRSPDRPARGRVRTPRAETTTATARPPVRFHHDGQPMADSQNRLSSLAFQFTAGIDGDKPRISTVALRRLLHEAGVDDPKSAPWSVKLANGITIAAKVEKPAKARRS